MEYILVTGFALLILTPVIYLLYSSMRSYETETSSAQASAIGRELLATAERVWHHGPPSRLTVEVSMPAGITNMTLRRNDPASGCTKCTELIFTLTTGGFVVTSSPVDVRTDGTPLVEVGVTTYAFNTSVHSPGVRRFTLEAFGDHVELQQR